MTKKKQSALTKADEHDELQAFRVRDRDDGGFDQLTPPEEAAAAVKRMFGVSDTGTLGTRGFETPPQRGAVLDMAGSSLPRRGPLPLRRERHP
jgi:hypothetical protein